MTVSDTRERETKQCKWCKLHTVMFCLIKIWSRSKNFVTFHLQVSNFGHEAKTLSLFTCKKFQIFIYLFIYLLTSFL